MKIWSLDTETTGLSPYKGDKPFLFLGFDGADYFADKDTAKIKEICEDENIIKVFHNAKFDIKMLQTVGVETKGIVYDTMLAAHLLDENRKSQALKFLAKELLGEETNEEQVLDDWFKNNKVLKKDRRYDRLPDDIVIPYGKKDVLYTYKLWEMFEPQLKEQKLWDLFIQECGLMQALVDIENRGVLIDKEKTLLLKNKLEQKMEMIQAEIKEQYGEKFNFRSGKQLGDVLINDGVKVKRTDKGSVRTDEKSLCEYDHPLSKQIVEYRKAQKLKKTYCDGFLDTMDDNDVIHCNYRQSGTVTGRFSCVKEDTKILTKKGYKQIKNIKIGDKVKTHTGQYQRVIDTQIKGIDKMYNVRFCNGKILTCTKSHKLLLYNKKWKTLEEIVNGKKMDTSKQSGAPIFAHPLLAGEGLQSVTIKEINPAGYFEVYDITVEKDHSYLSCGVFNHNSAQPNLQNIPRQGNVNRKTGFQNNTAAVIRELFKVREEFTNFYFDYSQIEYRLAADYSGDDDLIDRINNGEDIHTIQSQRIFKKQEISKEERVFGKIVNFGILYGAGVPSMADLLRVSIDEAQKVFDDFIKANPKINRLRQEINRAVYRRGFVVNKMGRRRRLKGTDSYKALNSLCQGLAADIIKRAMVRIHDLLRDTKSNIIMNVHDEICVEIHDTEKYLVPKIKEIMEDFTDLFKVKIEVGCDCSKTNWAEKKEFT